MAEYTTQHVAFLDILGFSQRVKESCEVDDILNILMPLTSYARYANQVAVPTVLHHGQEYHNLNQIRAFAFSDSICVSVAADQARGLHELSEAIKGIQFHMLNNYEVLLRGAIETGPFHYDPQTNILFGAAFITAVEKEKNAVYPRVLVNESTFISDASLYRRCDDGLYMIDYIPSEISPEGHKRLKEIIHRNCENQHYSELARMKWEWTKSYYQQKYP